MIIKDKQKKNFLKRFSQGSANECWNWKGVLHKYGYGVFSNSGLSHRISYELFKGPIPEGMCVLHKCDNPSCVNPNHLFLGTRVDNNKDRDMKGRNKYVSFSGELNPNFGKSHPGINAGKKNGMFGKQHTEASLEKMKLATQSRNLI